MLRMDSAVHTSGDSMSYCSECLEKILPWKIPDTAVLSSWFDDLHRDLYELMECSKRCTLCQYICNLFGQSHLNRFLLRVTNYNSKSKERSDLEATKEMGYGRDDCKSLRSLPQALQVAPTVSIQCNASDSYVESNGNIDRVVVCIRLEHHVSELWKDARVFMLYSEAGMLHVS